MVTSNRNSVCAPGVAGATAPGAGGFTTAARKSGERAVAAPGRAAWISARFRTAIRT